MVDEEMQRTLVDGRASALIHMDLSEREMYLKLLEREARARALARLTEHEADQGVRSNMAAHFENVVRQAQGGRRTTELAQMQAATAAAR